MLAAAAFVELSIGTPSTTISGWPVPLSVRVPRILMTAEAPGSPACDCTSTLGALPARAATMFISLLRWISDESTLLRTLPSFSAADTVRSEEHTSELQSQSNLVCRLLLEKKKKNQQRLPHRLNQAILHTSRRNTL